MSVTDLLTWHGKNYPSFYVIQNHDLHAGFSALLTYALNGIRRARAMNAIPVIDFNKDNSPYFYDPKKGPSIWEYYFEPVSPYTPEQINNWLEAGLLSQEQVRFSSAAVTEEDHHYDPERLATFWAWEEPENKPLWMANKRHLGRTYVQQYVQVKAHITDKLEQFIQVNLGQRNAIGVHIRGTDFAYAKPTPIEAYMHELDKLIVQKPWQNSLIFVATDQKQYLEAFVNKYAERVVYLDALRSESHIAPFRFDNVSGYLKGEDVLLDILLLSRCQHIIKSSASIGEVALWFSHTDSITDFAIQSHFNRDDYRQQNSAYALLNISGKSPFKLKLHKFKEWLVRRLVTSRVGLMFYTRFDFIRRLLKH